MRRPTFHYLAMLAVSMISLVAAQSALAALPEFKVPAGEEFPVQGIASSRAIAQSVKLEEQLGIKLYAEQVKVAFEVKSAGPTALVEFKLTNVWLGLHGGRIELHA